MQLHGIPTAGRRPARRLAVVAALAAAAFGPRPAAPPDPEDPARRPQPVEYRDLALADR